MGYPNVKPRDFNGEPVIVRVWTSMTNLKNLEQQGSLVGHVSVELLRDGERGSWGKGTYISAGPDMGAHPSKNTAPFLGHDVVFTENYESELFENSEQNEGRIPEFTFVFHMLDSVAIFEHVKKLPKIKNIEWTMTGRQLTAGKVKDSFYERICHIYHWYLLRPFSFLLGIKTLPAPSRKSVSCVSLAMELLEAGNIAGLLDRLAKAKILLDSSEESQDTSSQAVSELMKTKEFPFRKMLRSLGYVTEFAVSAANFFPTPDYLVPLLMEAKRRELAENNKQYPELVFENTVVKDTFTCREWRPKDNEEASSYSRVYFAVTVIVLFVALYIGSIFMYQI